MHKVHRTVALVLRIPFAFPMKALNEAVSLARAVFGDIDYVLLVSEEKRVSKKEIQMLLEYPFPGK